LILKLLSCILYIAEVESLRMKADIHVHIDTTDPMNNCTSINWQKILFVDRDQNVSIIKIVQFFIACYGLFETMFYLLLSFNVIDFCIFFYWRFNIWVLILF